MSVGIANFAYQLMTAVVGCSSIRAEGDSNVMSFLNNFSDGCSCSFNNFNGIVFGDINVDWPSG